MATPRIDRLLAQGLDKSEIVARLTGTRDGAGAADQLTRAQLEAIGFGDRFIANQLGTSGSGGTGWRSPFGIPTPGSDSWRPPTGGGGGGGSTPGSGGGGGSTPGGTGPLPVAFSQSAYDLMAGLLQQYGLGSLAGRLRQLISDGITDQASLTLALQDTNEWRQRFSGNEALRQQGLPVLTVAEYLATERSYAQIMKNFGLPQGFYDDPADFGKFIGNNISASELQDRVQTYADLANREDPAMKEQLRAMGLGDGDLIAFMMDPERANPLIQRKAKTALVGAAARRVGLDAGNAERLAELGVTEQQAVAGFAVISENLGAVDRLGEIYGVDYDQGDFEAEIFEGDGKAARKRKRLASQERAAFSGSSGVSRGSLGQSTAGQF